MPYNKTKVLIVEDDVCDRTSLEKYIVQNNLSYDYTFVNTVDEAKELLGHKKFDVIVADCEPREVVSLSYKDSFDYPLILVTGKFGKKEITEVLKSGAYDYVFKDSRQKYLGQLRTAIENAMIHRKYDTQNHMLMSAVMNTGDSIFVTDPDEKIIFVNNTFCTMYGWSRDEIHGKKVDILQKEIPAFKTESDSIGIGGNYFHIRKDGTEFPAHVTITRVYDEDGKLEAMAWIARDITERNKLEQEKINAEKLQSVLEMAGAACHELSQPLQAILGFAELLLIEMEKGNPLHETARLIKSEADRLRKVFYRITNITEYATLDYPGGKKIIDLAKASPKADKL